MRVLFRVPVTGKHVGSAFLCQDEEGSQCYGTVYQYGEDKNFYCEEREEYPVLEDVKYVYEDTPPKEFSEAIRILQMDIAINHPGHEYLTANSKTQLQTLLNFLKNDK